MRVALLSDVHANLTALEAVLAELDEVEEIWVMGDTVGYGPDPADVLACLVERGAHLVAGNHDRAVATGEGLELFNGVAAAAARMHRSWLGAADRDRLAALPPVLSRRGATLFHGSLRDPFWEYVTDARAAARTIEAADTDLCCNGHTHVPALFVSGEKEPAGERGATTAGPPDGQPPRARRTMPRATRIRADVPYPLGQRSLVNPGSVGQPRDHHPEASWALLDTEARTVTFRRTAYDVRTTQERILGRGLPEFLARRLEVGL